MVKVAGKRERIGSMELEPPHNRTTLCVKVVHDDLLGRRAVTLDVKNRDEIREWNASICVYVVVRNRTIQYVGSSSRDFFQRFTDGIRQAHRKGYRWPTTDGCYELFLWKIEGPRYFAEAVEAEVAFIHRAVLGDWPIELNQISPKRHLVHPEASAFGKSLAFGIYAWLLRKEHITSTPDDLAILNILYDRSIIC